MPRSPRRRVASGAVLHLAIKLVGGAQLGKAVKGKSKDKGKGKNGGHEATEEERKLQESIRRLEMNDYLKKLTLTKKAMLQDFLAKEAQVSRTNQLKIQNHWRKILRLVKVEALRKEVEVRAQNHERDVDRRDAIIQMFDRDLDEAEEQLQTALRSHLLNIDDLIDIQDDRLLSLEKEFETDLRRLEREFDAERERVMAQHSLEQGELQRIMSAVQQQDKDRENEARQEHEQLREEIRNKNLEDINVLRITLDGSIEELEQHFEAAHLNYLQNTDQRTQDFKYLTAKDLDLSRDIELKLRKIDRLQSSLVHWRSKIAQNTKENAERNRQLEEEKAALSVHYQKLKSRMNKMRDVQRRRLTDLSSNAREAKIGLDERLELMERILHLGELVRKLETERERVLPYYVSTLEDETAANELTEAVRRNLPKEWNDENAGTDESLVGYQPKAELNGIEVSEWESLDLFWKRFNKVQLDNLAISREKERLEAENRELQTILQRYLDGVTVNDSVIDHANPLFVVNGRLRVHNPDADSTKTVVEGNHMVQTNRISRG